MMLLRRIFLCWWGGCGGKIEMRHNKRTIFWACTICRRERD
jgi:hypothetical protein